MSGELVVRARRAKPRRSRVVISLIVVIVALLAGGAVAVLLFWPDSLTATIRRDAPSAVTESSPSPNPTPDATATPSTTPSRSATPTPSAAPNSSAALKVLDACRDRVRAADEVLRQARTGVQHWAAHVDAERRAADGEITSPSGSRSSRRPGCRARATRSATRTRCGRTGPSMTPPAARPRGPTPRWPRPWRGVSTRNSAQATVMGPRPPRQWVTGSSTWPTCSAPESSMTTTPSRSGSMPTRPLRRISTPIERPSGSSNLHAARAGN